MTKQPSASRSTKQLCPDCGLRGTLVLSGGGCVHCARLAHGRIPLVVPLWLGGVDKDALEFRPLNGATHNKPVKGRRKVKV